MNLLDDTTWVQIRTSTFR